MKVGEGLKHLPGRAALDAESFADVLRKVVKSLLQGRGREPHKVVPPNFHTFRRESHKSEQGSWKRSSAIAGIKIEKDWEMHEVYAGTDDLFSQSGQDDVHAFGRNGHSRLLFRFGQC